ncbi:Golgi-associated plant pathogenesis-related protein 1-like isoform X3 [Gadus chalcogrammus]|uniref:Golgi-associated plant pathogenesis-related protein 1-like isoform X3 n=1 Tax=Gadus chalcogrammus TaxID=1042646 RepID=UPI0024C2C874|nr:Golgi-associated plant pathogenesis-related protein 1-like isoform X3 [Gadus chalcogrammus]XP_056447477.1 Golgi-associated plant pathogenesis-related protein 1-like isoform X3 [Gadus chalcogrammus]
MADESFQQEFLTKHNIYRQMHQSPPLTMSTDLNKSAQSWADHLLDNGIMQHSGSGVGENLYCMSSSAPINLTGKEAVESWYEEVKDYDYNRPGFKGNTGSPEGPLHPGGVEGDYGGGRGSGYRWQEGVCGGSVQTCW